MEADNHLYKGPNNWLIRLTDSTQLQDPNKDTIPMPQIGRKISCMQAKKGPQKKNFAVAEDRTQTDAKPKILRLKF